MNTLHTKQRKNIILMKNNISLYGMLTPGLIFFFIMCYIPMIFLFIAFQDYNIGNGILGSPFVGFKHFQELFRDDFFGTIVSNTVLINVLKIIFGFPVPIFIALCFNEIRDGIAKRFIQFTIYLPHFLSWVVVMGLMLSMFSVNTGLVNKILTDFGFESVSFLGSAKLYKPYLVLTEIWKESGWSSILYIAALTSIDASLYEAARVDGASRLRQIWHISLPGISSTIFVIFILSLGSLLGNSFEQVFVTINPAVYTAGEIIPTYVYNKGITELRLSYAAAVGLFQSIIGFILVYSTNKISRKIGGDTLW